MRKETESVAARDALLEQAAGAEVVDPALCLRIARASLALGDAVAAYEWLRRVADTPGPFVTWAAAGAALGRFEAAGPPPARRSVRVALAGSYTTSQLVPLLRLAALRRGVHVDVYEAGYDSYVQEVLDPSSGLYAFRPDYVILAPHEGAVRFPPLTEAAAVDAELDREVGRWTRLWDTLRERCCGRVVQHTVALRPDTAWGHVGARMPGSRDAMVREFNTRLARAAGDDVLIVDCERIAAAYGTERWFDDRYWHKSKQAVALDALPLLARHTAAVLAAAEGLSAKCVVLDLDNTLWGGVIGEDGLSGIRLGDGPQGEAYVAFQEHLLALRARGIVLAVASKNDEAAAREPFERHPDMRLKLSDFAAFRANWEDKATNIRALAAELNLGLDALVFVDDNPAEREIIRQRVPEVEVLAMPADPADYVGALSDSLLFEAAAITADDLGRADRYQARAEAARAERDAGSLEEFYASLRMQALIEPVDDLNLPRVAQLVGKTNQFNVTTRRHGLETLRGFMEDDGAVALYLRLRDRFTDHGLVGVLIALERDGGVLEIDTWLMSCRVIGRTAENAMLRRLAELAVERGRTRLRGTFIPTAKNAVVGDLFARLGFSPAGGDGEHSFWEYDIEDRGLPASEFIGTWSEDAVHA